VGLISIHGDYFLCRFARLPSFIVESLQTRTCPVVLCETERCRRHRNVRPARCQDPKQICCAMFASCIDHATSTWRERLTKCKCLKAQTVYFSDKQVEPEPWPLSSTDEWIRGLLKYKTKTLTSNRFSWHESASQFVLMQ